MSDAAKSGTKFCTNLKTMSIRIGCSTDASLGTPMKTKKTIKFPKLTTCSYQGQKTKMTDAKPVDPKKK